jgi:hypothetical protein
MLCTLFGIWCQAVVTTKKFHGALPAQPRPSLTIQGIDHCYIFFQIEPDQSVPQSAVRVTCDDALLRMIEGNKHQ